MKYLKKFEMKSADIWKSVDEAQLKEYEKNGPKEITLGDIEYKITKCWMDQDTDVPMVGLMNIKTNQIHSVKLSMIWSGYENWSALDGNGRERLRTKYFL